MNSPRILLIEKCPKGKLTYYNALYCMFDGTIYNSIQLNSYPKLFIYSKNCFKLFCYDSNSGDILYDIIFEQIFQYRKHNILYNSSDHKNQIYNISDEKMKEVMKYAIIKYFKLPINNLYLENNSTIYAIDKTCKTIKNIQNNFVPNSLK